MRTVVERNKEYDRFLIAGVPSAIRVLTLGSSSHRYRLARLFPSIMLDDIKKLLLLPVPLEVALIVFVVCLAIVRSGFRISGFQILIILFACATIRFLADGLSKKRMDLPYLLVFIWGAALIFAFIRLS